MGQTSALDAVAEATGIVIPAFVPETLDVRAAETLVRDTVASFCRQVRDASRVCVSVDGPGPAEPMAETLSRQYGVQMIVGDRNRGKLGPVRQGMLRLLGGTDLRYLAVADQDGDHFANELVNFVRAAQFVQETVSTDKVMVLGRRISRHRPMGWLRGELEELADRMLLDALQYHAAVTGRPLALEFSTTHDEFPDFHSGYKLFTVETAADVFTPEPELAGLDEAACYRHAVEAVITVEAIRSGARLVEVNRSTINEQPVSAFGLLDRVTMVSDKIIWPCKRLDVPAAFVRQWLDNHLPRLLLGTLAPLGATELRAIRERVLTAFGLAPDRDAAPLRPPFV